MSQPIESGQSITPPANFPITWENPEDAGLTWHPDNHSSQPKAPLSFSVSKVVLQGFNPAFSRLGLPIRFRLASVNGYLYVAISPAGEEGAEPDDVARKRAGIVSALAASQIETLNAIFERFETYWHEELLPKINQHLAYIENCDLRGLSEAQLLAHFRESLKRATKIGELHARAAMPAMAAMSMFEEFYRELFPGSPALDALRLLRGFDNQTLTGDRELWRLSRVARSMPAVRQTLAERPAGEAIMALRDTADGRRFLADLRGYLDRYGQRLLAFGQLTEPSWIENPVNAIDYLQTYIKQDDGDKEAEQARLIAEREQAVADARTALAGRPQTEIDKFNTLLKSAQVAVGIKEDNHWVIERLFYQMRRQALALGRRLAEDGLLERAEDVFFLSAEEVIGSLSGVDTLPEFGQLQARKAQREHYMRINPPPVLGAMPASRPKDEGPYGRAMKKADGAVTPGGAGAGRALRGQAASAGVARGRACIIRTLAEAGRLQPGDILVAKRTMPPWTPFFAIAAAVVTDTGGILSHCAVVAREYQIPAVVGTARATEFFHDGQLLEVDGNAGVVRIVA